MSDIRYSEAVLNGRVSSLECSGNIRDADFTSRSNGEDEMEIHFDPLAGSDDGVLHCRLETFRFRS
jgi:hypothetical protein